MAQMGIDEEQEEPRITRITRMGEEHESSLEKAQRREKGRWGKGWGAAPKRLLRRSCIKPQALLALTGEDGMTGVGVDGEGMESVVEEVASSAPDKAPGASSQ